jgi:hypothetical protein
MIQHYWTIPCRLSLTDRETNNVTLVEILEEISIPEFPIRAGEAPRVIPAFFDVVTLWSREYSDRPETGFGRVSLVPHAGEPIVFHEFEVNLMQAVRSRSVGRIVGFPLVPAGVSLLRVERRMSPEERWEQVAALPIRINRLENTNPPQNGPT